MEARQVRLHFVSAELSHDCRLGRALDCKLELGVCKKCEKKPKMRCCLALRWESRRFARKGVATATI